MFDNIADIIEDIIFGFLGLSVLASVIYLLVYIFIP